MYSSRGIRESPAQQNQILSTLTSTLIELKSITQHKIKFSLNKGGDMFIRSVRVDTQPFSDFASFFITLDSHSKSIKKIFAIL